MDYTTPNRAVVDGVTTLSLRLNGPMRAMLVFRVGAADEALPIRGITHLAEHLALFSILHKFEPWRLTGSVQPFFTKIGLSGTPSEITSFLAEVTSNLADLPTDRLEDEKRVLRTEAAGRPRGSQKELSSYRFGAQGLGVVDFQEYGCRWIGPELVSRWAAERFNRDNAILWLSRDVPDDLRLMLRPGERYPRPTPKPLEVKTPAVYALGSNDVALSVLATASKAAFLGAQVLDRRVQKRLRIDESLAYHAYASYLPIGGGLCEITAYADSLADRAGEAARALISVVQSLAAEGHRPEEMQEVIAGFRRAREYDDAGHDLLNDAAVSELNGRPDWTWPEVDEEAAEMEPAEVAETFTRAFETVLLAVPEGVSVEFEGFTPLPPGSGSAITGKRVFPVAGSDVGAVIDYSDMGISTTDSDKTIGFAWRDVAAALWWTDGSRTLIGPDCAYITIEPGKWMLADALLEAVRVNVPPASWVPMDQVSPLQAPNSPASQMPGVSH